MTYITGRACRLPGAPDVASFRTLLREGCCSVTEIPQDRWRHDLFLHPKQGVAGKSYSFAAGVLDDIWGFDLSVFNLSPREVVQMDPQQRLLLQVVWEALEDARMDPNGMSGQDIGVYVGASSMDHGTILGRDPALSDAYMMTGNTLSLVANRISHAFDWRGPSFVVDTACSSSMVALDLARQALASGQIDTAVVAGVNLLLNPGSFVGFSAARMLSATGRCRSFSDQADGYVRSEGAVAVILRRAASPPATATARLVDSEINADGRTVNVALPSQEGQYRLLSRLYARAGVDPAALSFVEAHGTGTLVGDPIEAMALGRALARQRTAPLPIGSVKSNIGHLEPASGLAGLLKSLIAFEDRRLPASLHVDALNPHVDFEAENLEVVREAFDLPPDGPLIAGISSFGFGGVNGHCIIEAVAPIAAASPAAPMQRDRIFVTSAFCTDALRDLAQTYATRIAQPGALAPGALVDQAWHGRGLHPRRLGVLASSEQEAARALSSFASGEKHPAVMDVVAEGRMLPAVFVYSGNGAQYAGMSRLALAYDAVYAQAYADINEVFKSQAGWNLLDRLASDSLATDLDDCTVAQSLLFADQVAQTVALAARGVTPAAVIGHSGGEVSAAWASGALDLHQAVDLVVLRSRTVVDLAGSGTMAALQTGAENALSAIKSFTDEAGGARIDIAAVNSPVSVTLVGPVEQLKSFSKWVRRQHHLACLLLPINYPYHSAMMDSREATLKHALASLRPVATQRPFYSSTLGQSLPGTALDAEYWWKNLRQTVQFENAVTAAAADGFRAFLEIGAQPVLSGYLAASLDGGAEPAAITHSLSRTDPESVNPIARAALRAVLHGMIPTEGCVFVPPGGAVVPLPQYPWQMTQLRATHSAELQRSLGTDASFHPLLGVQVAGGAGMWRRDLDHQIFPVLADHKIGAAPLLPATAFVEMAFAAATRVAKGAVIELTDLDLSAPLVFSGDHLVEVQTRADPDTRQIRIESRRRLGDEPFREHLRARFVVLAQLPAPPHSSPPLVGKKAARHRLYRAARQRGLNYGPAFRGVDVVTCDGDRIDVTLRKGSSPWTQSRLQGFDPVEVDCLLHGLIQALEGTDFDRNTLALIPVRIDRVHVLAQGRALGTGRIEIVRRGKQSIVANLTGFDWDGLPVLRLEGLRLRATQLVTPIDTETQSYHVAAQTFMPATRPPSRRDGLAAALVGATPDIRRHDDALLLIDAAAHQAVWQAFDAAVGPDRRYDLRHASSDTEGHLLAMIARLGLATPILQSDSWTISPGCDIPSSALLTEALLAERRDLIAEISVLLQLPEALAGLLAQAQDSPPDAERWFGREPLALATFGRGAAARMIAAAFDHICAEKPENVALRLAVVGADVEPFRLMTSTVQGVSRWRLRLTGSDTTPTPHGCTSVDMDEVTGIDALAVLNPGLTLDHDVRERLLRCVRPGGQIMVLVSAEPALSRAVGAFDAQPLQSDVPAETAIRRLQDLGCALDLRHSLPDEIGGGDLIVATKPAVAPQAVLPPRSVPSDWRELWHDLHGPCTVIAGPVTVIVPKVAAAACLALVDAAHPPDTLPDRMLALRDAVLIAADEGRALTAVLPNGASYDGGPVPDPDTAALWAMLRTAANEYPALHLRAIDTAPVAAMPSSALLDVVRRIETEPRVETEIVLTPDGPRALRVLQGLPPSRDPVPAQMTGLTLRTAASPRLDALRWMPTARPAPARGEVEIEIAATGLNYRDVMWAMGLLPEEALEGGFAGPTLGFECSGRVSRLGADVQDMSVGDAVIAFGPACFSTHLVAPRVWVTPVPQGLSLPQAAALPVAYFTAHYALLTLGDLQPGETVLIHGGAGGVGLAAIAVARSRKARIIATAGNPVKQTYLRKLGVDHVLSSRDPGFADQVRAVAGPDGVDVVLNSLAGQAMEQSLALLRPYGRFLELGKQDFYSNTGIGLRALKDNIAYHGIDVDHVLAHRPDNARQTFAEVVSRLHDGRYPALPFTKFDGRDTIEAFRAMQRSAHIGKIVVCPPDRATAQVAVPEETEVFAPDSDGWHVLAGGLGGLGLETMEWLDLKGARRIALLGRLGQASPEAVERIETLRAHGAEVRVIACDIACGQAVDAMFAALRRDAPIASVFHLAMVLEDRNLAQIDAASLARTLSVKTEGLRHLDQATRADRLQAFVAFTSLATMIGNPGQSAYVAANAWQEALMRARHAAGLPALAIGLGAVSDAGYVSRDAVLGKVLDTLSGRARLTADMTLDALGKLLMVPAASPCVTVTPMNWGQAAKVLPILKHPTHAALKRLGDAQHGAEPTENLRADLQALPFAKAVKRASTFLKAEIAGILRVSVESLNSTRPLTDYGMDSLMAVELALAAQRAFGDDLPQPSLSDGLSIERLAEIFVTHMQAIDPLSVRPAEVAASHADLRPDGGAEFALGTAEAAE